MKKVKIYNSYGRLFGFLLLLINCVFIFLLIIVPETAHDTLIAFLICNLIFVMGLFIKTPLLVIESHSITIKNGEEMLWNEIMDIQVGKKIRNLSFREKIPNPFANHGAFNNYDLRITPIDQPSENNTLISKKIKLNFSDLHPNMIEELLFYAVQGTKVVMFRNEEVE